MNKICYLAFDGVLHSSAVHLSQDYGIQMQAPGRALFEWAPILEELLESHPDVSIVLSTSWAGEWGEEFARDVLPGGLKRRVIGSIYTPENLRHFDALSRGRQVTSDAQKRRPETWFAIDDDTTGWPDAMHGHLILTDGATGISTASVQNAIRRALASL